MTFVHSSAKKKDIGTEQAFSVAFMAAFLALEQNRHHPTAILFRKAPSVAETCKIQ